MKSIVALAAMFMAVGIGQDSALDRQLIASEHLIYAPPGDLTAPSDASELGLLSRVASVATVPFGFESDEIRPRPATSAVEPHFIRAATLREALDAFVRLDPRYEWRDLGGVYVVRPIVAWNDASNVLNQPVGDIRWRDLSVFSAFDHIAHLLYPRDKTDIYTGLEIKNDRPFNVDVSHATVLDVLDEAARADGELGWWVRYGGASDLIKFELTIGHYGIGPTHGWRERPTRSGACN